MSTRRGNAKRQAPAHQNKYAFRHNKKSRKTALIANIPNVGLCSKCARIVEWRKQYRKYKPLTAPRKCNVCSQKNIGVAYHSICRDCAQATGKCPHCMETLPPTTDAEDQEVEFAEVKQVLDDINVKERHRRMLLRKWEAGTLSREDIRRFKSHEALEEGEEEEEETGSDDTEDESEEDGDGDDNETTSTASAGVPSSTALPQKPPDLLPMTSTPCPVDYAQLMREYEVAEKVWLDRRTAEKSQSAASSARSLEPILADADRAYHAALALLFGLGATTIDSSRGFRLAKQAMKGGAPHARSLVAWCYYWGRGVRDDDDDARKHWCKSRDDMFTLVDYADVLRLGDGIMPNPERARKYYARALPLLRKAATAGDVRAQFSLGWLYYHGNAGEDSDRSLSEAFKWFMEAAKQGHAEAQLWVGHAYRLGQGAKLQAKIARKWYQQAVQQGHPDGAHWLHPKNLLRAKRELASGSTELPGSPSTVDVSVASDERAELFA